MEYLKLLDKILAPGVILTGVKIMGIITISIVLYSFVRENLVVRQFAISFPSAKYFFCHGKELCKDARCVGETWRDTMDCAEGSSKVGIKLSCDNEMYSDCKKNGTISGIRK